MINSILRNKAVLAALSLILFFAFSCSEEKIDIDASGTLEGTVLDFTSEINLQGAILTTNPPTVSVASDSTGYFVFNSIEVGDYSLIARKNGFISESVNVSVKKDRTSNVVILMERSSEYNDPPKFKYASFHPLKNSSNCPVTTTLSWKAMDPNREDSLSYKVNVFTSGSLDFFEYETKGDTFLILENLAFNKVYYWQVSVSDSYESVQSELFNFRTIPLPDNDFLFTRKTDGNYEIYSSDSLGITQVRLSWNNINDWYPRSSSKKTIAFISHENLESHIFTMTPEGAERKRITSHPVTGYHNTGRGFAWSPNGDYIIYSHYNRLYRIDSRGGDEKVLVTAPEERHFRDLDYSPNGNLIVAQTIGVSADSSEIYLFNANGTNQTLLVGNLPGIIESPVFSIDGNKVMYTRDISESALTNGRQLNAHIFIIDINTKKITDISHLKEEGTNDLNPRFSPNGAFVIFENSSNETGSIKSTYIMDLDGSNRKKIFHDAEMPAWN